MWAAAFCRRLSFPSVMDDVSNDVDLIEVIAVQQ
jgi:hypothetical protein